MSVTTVYRWYDSAASRTRYLIEAASTDGYALPAQDDAGVRLVALQTPDAKQIRLYDLDAILVADRERIRRLEAEHRAALALREADWHWAATYTTPGPTGVDRDAWREADNALDSASATWLAAVRAVEEAGQQARAVSS